MLKSRHILPTLLVVMLAGFGLGVVWLFQLRFNAGDIYPPYSSLRADPLGAKAFYESLQNMPGISARRFFQDSSKLEGSPQRVLFLCGTDNEDLSLMPESDFKILKHFLFNGGRVVISLSPEQTREITAGQAEAPSKKPGTNRPKTPRPARGGTPSDEESDKTISFLATNQLRLEFDRLFIPNATASHADLVEGTNAPPGLPASISWHSPGYFTGLETNWRTVYQIRKRAVMIERSFGTGSLVLATDSFFLSNEALRSERHVDLLAWLLGNRREVLFDETHLGVHENPGVATLMRQYHLQGMLLGLLLVAALFIWKNSSSLVPPPAEETAQTRSALVAGQESTAGFASLLRRSIPPAEILAVCFAEWKAACARQPRAASRLAAIEQIIGEEQARPPRARLPVQTWQSIQRILSERK